MHEKHSSDRTVISLSTLINEGHAFVHNPQSMQLILFLLILLGLINETNPSNAP
jgi:hypothetical protein